jgi:hypothetical protein
VCSTETLDTVYCLLFTVSYLCVIKNRTRLLLEPKTPLMLNGVTSLEVMTVSNITLPSRASVDPILTVPAVLLQH